MPDDLKIPYRINGLTEYEEALEKVLVSVRQLQQDVENLNAIGLSIEIKPIH